VKSNNYKSNFWEYLLLSNKEYLPGFKRWVFYPGMLFNSHVEWWGDKKRRSTAHQGLDLCFFADTAGHINNVARSLKIPAAFSGEMVQIEPDFLGKSLYLRHDIFSGGPRQLYTIFGHTNPFPAVRVGQKVAAGEPLAQLAGVSQGANILPHLHLTLVWIPVAFNPKHLNWRHLADDRTITFVDPCSILSTPG
jgi:murein DD-endopeptidase MepM/ murein hydrolase activator NlpD